MDPTAMNVKGVSDLVNSGLNKVPYSPSDAEGIADDKEDLLELKTSDADLLAMAATAEAKYAPYEGKIKPRQQANKAYYLGMQMQGSPQAADYPIASNLLFEAEETFLPAALSKNPEPVVWSDDTTEGATISRDVKTMLQYHADVLVLRRKMNRLARQWSIYLIAAFKHGWDAEIGEIKTETVDPRNFVFDPDGYIDEYGDYRGGLLGYRVTTTAQKMADMFQKEAAFITVMVDGFMATKVTYTEWRTDEACFYTFKNRVVDKHKNELFNYARKVKDLDEDGALVEREEEGRNHFARPKMPYTFLSVFSIGEQPHDMTGLLEQNIPQQNRITKRDVQIDKNLDRSNNSIGLSGNNFNEETAKQAAVALEKGHPVLIPTGGPISEAIARFPAPDLPNALFVAQENDKVTLRSIFGTQGITSQKPDDDQTARGMILQQSFDTSRIGGGIGDVLEQVADNVFNWWVQLYYVFYDEAHYASILGQLKAVEYVKFSSAGLKKRLVVSVSPNSMKPKDEVTEMNQAMALFDKGVLDPKTLYTILDFPDPQKTAEQAVLWMLDKQAYMAMNFPELAQELAARQQAAMAAASGGAIMPAGESAPPEQANGEPAEGIAVDPASAALSEVPIST
jgi:hypothetical protein